jgi:cell wall-associated NlpC family hydrolase
MTAVPLNSPKRLAQGMLAAIAGVICSAFLLAAAVLSSPSASPVPTGSVDTSRIPAPYVTWVLRAGSLCTAITPAIIAAQDQVESSWNPGAVSSAGAEGIAQFLPATFVTWGRNDDGTGDVSPFNPRDAIMAQGRYDCSLAALAQNLLSTGQATGTAADVALAAYNAGPGAVEAAHGIPADAAGYVRQIDELAATGYTAASGQGLAAVAAAETALGTPYHYGGSCTDPHGSDPSGWCDCSSLAQMAWRAAGVNLPRTTYQQVYAGTPVTSVSQLQPGDLIFIPGSDGTAASPGHVGIYVGNGWLIDAPYTGAVVRFEKVSGWQSQIVAMRRP